MPITGCDYYPEHWSEDRWRQDAQLMRTAGLSVVRLAEFAWDKLEPQVGVYEFDWLEHAINILADEGLQIVMSTPTAIPPPWLTHQYPEICRVQPDGVRINTGARRHACANVPAYLENSARITIQVAEYFGQHPAVIGWQIDNEFGCGETTRCSCKHCQARFQHWLAEKYGALESLNCAWGTQFWGMTYHDWAHIPVPGITTEPQSPSMRLDYRRFSSDSWVRFQRMQVDILREHSPQRWITHNFMVRHWSLDYWKLAEDLDFVSYDNYPHGLCNPAEVAMNLDLMHSFKNRSFWIMEQQPGPVNWHPYNPPVPPGQVRLWSHQAIAHGAEAVVYFRYRASRSGQEQYHRGLLKWDGSLDQAYHEAQQVHQEIEDLPNLTRLPAKVGIYFDYNDLWSIELEPHTQEFSYWQLVFEIYQTYWQAGISVDFLPYGANLDGYETVIVPAAILTKPQVVDHWREWVAQGGRLIVTFRSFVREQSNIATAQSLPADIGELIGVNIQNYWTVPPADFQDWASHRTGTSIQSLSIDANSFTYKIWAEQLELTSAEALWRFADGFLADKPAITRNSVGTGEVFYVGCWVTDFAELAQTLNWIPTADNTNRQGLLADEDGSIWQIDLNHAADPQNNLLALDAHYQRLDTSTHDDEIN